MYRVLGGDVKKNVDNYYTLISSYSTIYLFVYVELRI